MRKIHVAASIAGFAATLLSTALPTSANARPQETLEAESHGQALVNRYCLSCHNNQALRGGLSLEETPLTQLTGNEALWERVLRKLRAGAMPPTGAPRPDPAAYGNLVNFLETSLDHIAASSPNPGRTETFRRLNRTEYRNAVRDLLALDVDISTLLPSDDASFGFDNV